MESEETIRTSWLITLDWRKVEKRDKTKDKRLLRRVVQSKFGWSGAYWVVNVGKLYQV